MGLEAAAYLHNLVATNPVSNDVKSEGDDHFRLLKEVLQATLPGLAGRIQRTQGKVASYNLVATDNLTLIAFTAGSSIVLSTAVAASVLGNGFSGACANFSGAAITFDPNAGELVNGATTFSVPNRTIAAYWTDGTAWYLGVMPVDNVGDFVLLAAVQTLLNKTHTNPAHTDQTLTDAASVIWDAAAGGIATLTLTSTGGVTRVINTPTNLKKGTYILHLIQGDATARTATWGTAYKWAGGVPPVLSSGSGKRDVFSFICDGTNLHGSYIPDSR